MDTILVSPERAGLELDEFLCLHHPGTTKGFWRAEVRAGHVLVDGEATSPAAALRRDQVVIVDVDDDAFSRAPRAPEAPLPILYEDERLLVVDKPPDLAAEPERWAQENASVAGALLSEARSRGDAEDGALAFRPRLLHRLDKDTSGAIAVAKDLDTERRLRTAFEEGTVDKEYVALVEGEVPIEDGAEHVIDVALDADARRSGRMRAVERGGKSARTIVSVAERFRGFTWLTCRPETGRTHQIRVHLAHFGFPLAVDPLYGRRTKLALSEIKAGYRPKPGRVERPLIDRLTLHARRLRLPGGPGGIAPVEVEAPLPDDLERVLKQLRKVRPHRTRRSSS